MSTFKGFPDGKSRLTRLPEQFFSELLPEVDHLAELKVILYAFWRLERMEGSFRYLERADFLDDERLMQGLSTRPLSAASLLDEGLERAVQRGVLLRAVFAGDGQERIYFFLNTPKGRAAVEAIGAGKWRPSTALRTVVSLDSQRPNIFRLYEEHIGPLTPMLAETLRDAQATYPEPWVEEAVRIAVENNKRSWKYIEAILRRWQEGGKDEQNRRNSEEDRRRYAEWESPER
jgi:DNA replication protein